MRKESADWKRIEKEVFKISVALFNELEPDSCLVFEDQTYKVVAKYYDLISKDEDNPAKVMKRYVKVMAELEDLKEKAND